MSDLHEHDLQRYPRRTKNKERKTYFWIKATETKREKERERFENFGDTAQMFRPSVLYKLTSYARNNRRGVNSWMIHHVSV